jgi:hypothetical protein
MLEVSHALMGIPLPKDYAKLVRKEAACGSGVSGQEQGSERPEVWT